MAKYLFLFMLIAFPAYADCDAITESEDLKHYCWALEKGDVTECLKIEDPDTRFMCDGEVSKNPEACMTISDDTIYLCELRAAKK